MNTQPESTPTMRAFAACLRSQTPVIFSGDPGQGKTSALDAWASAWGYYFESVTGSNRDATDFLGLPVEVDGVQRYTSLDWAVRLNTEAKARARAGAGSLLFLDEFNTQEDTMKAMLRVLEERFAGPDKFEHNVAIAGAMNPTGIATGGIDLPAPVANRVIHLDWHFDFDAWAEGFMSGFEGLAYPAMDTLLGEGSDADRARVRASIVTFLKSHSQSRTACPSDDPEAAAGAWPSPRMWTKAANALAELRSDDIEAQRLLLIGAVGHGAATAYMTWLRQNDLYDPAEVLANPSIVKWASDSPDRLYAMTLSVTELVKSRGDAASWVSGMKAMAAGANAGRPDTAWPGGRALINNMPKGAKIPTDAMTAFADLFDNLGLTSAA